MHIRNTFALMAIGALLMACSQESSEPVAETTSPQATDDSEIVTTVYDWHARGYSAGETTIRIRQDLPEPIPVGSPVRLLPDETRCIVIPTPPVDES